MGLYGIALRNLLRRPARTAAIFVAITVLAGTLATLSLMNAAVRNSVRTGVERMGADAMVVPAGWDDEIRGILLSGGPTEFYMKGAVAEDIAAVKGVEAVSGQLFVVSAPLSCCTVSDTMLVGFEPERDFTITPWLRETLERTVSDDEVIVGVNILAEPGGKIRFYGREFSIAGKLDPTGMPYIDSSVFIPMDGVRDMVLGSGEKARKTLMVASDDISAVLVRFGETAHPEQTALRIEHANPGLKVVLAGAIQRSARSKLLAPLRAVLVAAVLQWVASIFLIGVVFSLSVAERQRETGVLRALGAGRADVAKVMFLEIVMLSGIAGVSGISVGMIFVAMFKNLLKITFDVPFLMPGASDMPVHSLPVLFAAVFSGLAAAAYPIFRAASRDPYFSMRDSV